MWGRPLSQPVQRQGLPPHQTPVRIRCGYQRRGGPYEQVCNMWGRPLSQPVQRQGLPPTRHQFALDAGTSIDVGHTSMVQRAGGPLNPTGVPGKCLLLRPGPPCNLIAQYQRPWQALGGRGFTTTRAPPFLRRDDARGLP